MVSLDDIRATIQKTYENIKSEEKDTFISNIVKLQNNFANYLIEALKQKNYHENNEISKYIKGNTYKYVDNERLQNRLLKSLGKDISFESQREERKGKIKELGINNIETLKDLIVFYESLNQKSMENHSESYFPINHNIINRPEIQEIINNVRLNRGWDTDYAIRYVVVMISRLVKRDVKFFFSSEEEKLNALNTKTYSDYPNVICKTLSELIRDVLYLLGIESKVIVATNTKVPLYALIVRGEHNNYFIDALNDLFRTQYRIQPVTYGSFTKSNTNILDDYHLKLTDLPLDTIRQMDTDMEIIDDGKYFSDKINSIKDTLINRNKAKSFFSTNDSYEILKKKMLYIPETYGNLYPVPGAMERVGLYVFFRSNLFNKSEKNRFFVGNNEEQENYPVIIKIKYGIHELIYQEKMDKEGKGSLQLVSEVTS